MQLVEEARLYHLLPDRRSEFGTTKRCQPRKNAGTTQVILQFQQFTKKNFNHISPSQITPDILIQIHSITTGNCVCRRGR